MTMSYKWQRTVFGRRRVNVGGTDYIVTMTSERIIVKRVGGKRGPGRFIPLDVLVELSAGLEFSPVPTGVTEHKDQLPLPLALSHEEAAAL